MVLDHQLALDSHWLDQGKYVLLQTHLIVSTFMFLEKRTKG